jgi:signal transduction histidine kinase
MASTIIHDIKGPLTSIRGFTSLLGRSDLSDDQRRRFSEMTTQAVDSFVGMTQEILDYAEGKQSLEVADFSIESFLQDVQQFIAAEFSDDIEVRLNVENAGVVFGDRQKLWRVLYNIAKNAAEAMSDDNNGDGKGILTISCRRSGPWIEFILSDTGPGVPSEIRDSLFQPFVTCGKTHGTGLGLSIAHSIVEAHRGEVFVESEEGQGATFTVRLPAEMTSG